MVEEKIVKIAEEDRERDMVKDKVAEEDNKYDVAKLRIGRGQGQGHQ